MTRHLILTTPTILFPIQLGPTSPSVIVVMTDAVAVTVVATVTVVARAIVEATAGVRGGEDLGLDLGIAMHDIIDTVGVDAPADPVCLAVVPPIGRVVVHHQITVAIVLHHVPPRTTTGTSVLLHQV